MKCLILSVLLLSCLNAHGLELSEGERLEVRELIFRVQDQLQQQLKSNREELKKLSECLGEMGPAWKAEFTEDCKEYTAYVYSELPQNYLALRISLALAFPPTVYGPGARLWDFSEQVNTELRTLPSWPCEIRPTPLDASTEIDGTSELNIAKKAFFLGWAEILPSVIRGHDHEIDLLSSESTDLLTKEQLLRNLITEQDPTGQRIFFHKMQAYRLERVADLLTIMDRYRVLTLLKSPRPSTTELKEAFEQMHQANVWSSEEIAKDQAFTPADDAQLEHMARKYLVHQAEIEPIVQAHPHLSSVSVKVQKELSSSTHWNTGLDVAGHFLFGAIAPTPLAVLGFTASTTYEVIKAENTSERLKRNFISTLGSGLTSAPELYAQLHRTLRIYLAYPGIWAGAAARR